MKKIIFLEYIGKQVCLICSMILIVVRILDWFNPLMDFMGHSMFLLYALCIASVFLGVCEIYLRKPETKLRRARKNVRNR